MRANYVWFPARIPQLNLSQSFNLLHASNASLDHDRINDTMEIGVVKACPNTVPVLGSQRLRSAVHSRKSLGFLIKLQSHAPRGVPNTKLVMRCALWRAGVRTAGCRRSARWQYYRRAHAVLGTPCSSSMPA